MSVDQFQDFWSTWRRIIAAKATSPDEEFQAIFGNFLHEGATYCLPHGLSKIDFADQAQEIAETYGYIERFGQDALQQALAVELEESEARHERVPALIENGRGGELVSRETPAQSPEPMPFFDASEFAGVAVPRRRWLVQGRLPMRNVTLLSGDGAVGKTTIALQLAVSVATGRNDWLGAMIDEPGPVLFFTAEEERDEVHFRMDAISQHYDIDLASLSGKLMLNCAAGEDCVLATVNKQGLLDGTAIYRSLRQSAKDVRPKLVVIESAADVYGGNENDRAQVRQFVRMLRAIAIEVDCAVLILTHPSMSGMASGKGTSGTTAWNNSVRSRLYFSRPEDEEGEEEIENDQRELTVMKANFAARGESVKIVYHDGVFVLPGSQPAHVREANTQKADEVFASLLATFHASGRPVSPSPSTIYAPTLFEKEAAAKAARIKRNDLAAAMSRLLDQGRIETVMEGPPSKRRPRLQPKGLLI
jgi:RecA-family ATPase